MPLQIGGGEMSETGFDFFELDQFSQRLLQQARKENPKEVKKFMRKEGGKLRTRVARNARQRTKMKKGSYRKSIKRGKPYRYDNDDAIRVYSYAPHTHLIENPHRIISHKKDVGKSTKGRDVFRDAQKEFSPIFERDVDSFADNYARRVEK